MTEESKFEPTHEIMALIALRKLNLQTRMRSNPLGLDVWFLVRPFVYFHTLCGEQRRLWWDSAFAVRLCDKYHNSFLLCSPILNVYVWVSLSDNVCSLRETGSRDLLYPCAACQSLRRLNSAGGRRGHYPVFYYWYLGWIQHTDNSHFVWLVFICRRIRNYFLCVVLQRSSDIFYSDSTKCGNFIFPK